MPNCVQTGRRVPKGADWVVLAGSLPPGLEPTYYSRLVAALRASGYEGKIAIDTSEKAHDFATVAGDLAPP